MKIGIDASFLNRSHSGGKEQVLFNLLKGFQTLGKAGNIHVFAYDYSEDTIRGLIPDATFTFVRYKNSFIKKTMNDSFFKTFKLGNLTEQQGIDLLFFPHYNTGFKKFKIPTVVVPHDIQIKSNSRNFSWKSRLIYGLQYYFDFKLRNKIIAISNYDCKEIERYFPQYGFKIHRIYNPVDSDFSIQTKHNTNAKPYLCTINIAYAHKNTITLIKAFEKIMSKTEHNLVLIGRINKETEFLRTYVTENNLENRVQFTGFLEDPELNQTLSQASLYINPSLFEGFGLTTIEAAIRCVPVISSTTGASLEVTRGLLNYYDPADDSEILAEKILECLSLRQSQAELEEIRREYLDCYAYTQISSTYYKFFEGLM